MIDIKKIQPRIKKLAEKHRLLMVLLFGSQATGKTHAKSDFDFAILPEKRISLMDVAKMEMDFSQTLGIKKVELINLKEAQPFLLKQVAEKGVLLYEKEKSLFAKFRIYSFKMFMEAKTLLGLRELSLRKFLQKI